jgi:hypothetical protein
LVAVLYLLVGRSNIDLPPDGKDYPLAIADQRQRSGCAQRPPRSGAPRGSQWCSARWGQPFDVRLDDVKFLESKKR